MTPLTRKVAKWIEQQDSFTIKEIERVFKLSQREASDVVIGTKRHGYVYKVAGKRHSFTYKLMEIVPKEKNSNYTWLPDEYREKLGDFRELAKLTGLKVDSCRDVWKGRCRIHKKYLELVDGGVNLEDKRADLLKLALGI